jgi:LysM repeat protein
VKPGDTLSAIARRYHTTVAALQRLNNITDPKKLRVGQVLKLP